MRLQRAIAGPVGRARYLGCSDRRDVEGFDLDPLIPHRSFRAGPPAEIAGLESDEGPVALPGDASAHVGSADGRGVGHVDQVPAVGVILHAKAQAEIGVGPQVTETGDERGLLGAEHQMQAQAAAEPRRLVEPGDGVGIGVGQLFQLIDDDDQPRHRRSLARAMVA